MSQNNTPSDRRNQARSSGTPQQTPDVNHPNMGFAGSHQTQTFNPWMYQTLIQDGWIPANYPLPPPANFPLPPPANIPSQEDEFVPETQEPLTPQSIPTQTSNPNDNPIPTATQRGKQKKPFSNRAKPTIWTEEEEIALASAWVDVSEDPITGNSQKGESFWGKIEVSFYKFMSREKYRTKDQLNTKYKDLNKKVSCFAGIYNNVYNCRRSGMSDLDVLSTALARYRDENKGQPFKHEKVWAIWKECPKWMNQIGMPSNSTSRSSKRSKSSEEPIFNLNMHASDDDDDGDDDDDDDMTP